MDRSAMNAWNSKVQDSVLSWLQNDQASYFDFRYYFNSFDMGFRALMHGDSGLFSQKFRAAGRVSIPVIFQDTSGPTRDNAIAVVVTFNPDSQVMNNLLRMSNEFGIIIVVDNSPQGAPQLLLDFVATRSETVILILNHNKNGLAGAINRGIRLAFKMKQAGWIFWFDQDSEILPPFLPRILDALTRCSDTTIQGSLFGINYLDGKTTPKVAKNEIEEVATIITSGSFTRIENLRRLGLYIDELFIDSLDHEYCLRARRFGMSIRRISVPLMKHSLGNIELRSVPWKDNAIVTNHAPFRWYYFARNYVFTSIEGFPWNFGWVCGHGWALTKSYAKVLLFEQQKIQKTAAFFRGLKDSVKLIFHTKP